MANHKKIIDKDILKEMYEHYINKTKTLVEIGKEYGHDKERIRAQFKEQGWKINEKDIKIIIPTSLENTICEDYEKNNLTKDQLMVKYNFPIRTINRLLEKFDKKKTKSQAHTQAKKIIGNYFENIDTEDKAYFLGLLYADGCVSKDEDNNRISLTLQYGDKNIVEKMSDYILQENKVKYNEKNNTVRLQFKYKQIKDDLATHGCMPVKSFKIRMPTTVPKDLMRHFLRGLYDGDGCIHLYEDRKQVYVGLTSNKTFCEELQKYLLDNIKINSRIKINKNGNPDMADLLIDANAHKYLFLNFMYKNSNMSINRKFESYKEICNYINNSNKSKSIIKKIDMVIEELPEFKEYSRN